MTLAEEERIRQLLTDARLEVGPIGSVDRVTWAKIKGRFGSEHFEASWSVDSTAESVAVDLIRRASLKLDHD
jgi:hypothetical protein